MLTIYDLATAQRTILARRAGREGEPYPKAILDGIATRFGLALTPVQAVSRIIEDVAARGDAAVRSWTARLDELELEDSRVPPADLGRALEELSPRLRSALAEAAERIRRFHEKQPVASWTTGELGGVLGQQVTAIERVGIYVPGGSAPLPSSLLMSAIPAQVAGVGEIVVCTPPRPHPIVLAAAALCEVEHLHQIGGAQAIAAMAHGTESVPAVDKIVGPGNLFVTLAKRLVFGKVGIDGLAGPTETMVIADGSARADWVAADLLAQAEHDVLASAILLTPERALAETVAAEVARRAAHLSRKKILEQSLSLRSGIVITPDLGSAVEAANRYAPEHLCLSVADAGSLAARVKNAGGVFVGEHSFEVLGDYVAGPSHVMPTGGSARYASPLNVLDFVKLSNFIALDPLTSRRLSALAREIANAESLTAHAEAAAVRLKEEP